MKISLEQLKDLRNMTFASVADCKKALEEAEGALNKAVTLLRKRGLEIASNKQDRAAKEGRVEAYIHNGNKIGVLLEVVCETDFVARNAEFCQFTKDLAMQIAACSPSYIKKEDVPEEIISQEHDKAAYYKNHCLLEQPFIKDPGMTINDYMAALLAKFRENIMIRRFARYKIGA